MDLRPSEACAAQIACIKVGLKPRLLRPS